MRAYLRHAAAAGLGAEVVSLSDTPAGFREAVLRVSGQGAVQEFRAEVGVHRIQRVPPTERNGRRQTSTVTVAVLPVQDGQTKGLDERDLVIETFRAGGPGGQYQNKTESAVRVRHRPTGISVVCRSERSQTQNRRIAMELLAARLAERDQAEAQDRENARRRQQVGQAERSEYRRTYDFMRGCVRDRETGRTAPLDAVLDGSLALLR